MPTPVSTARQCLTEEAARALDDAVAVARRRSHSQTTSLHAVSALLSLTSSTLRDACARARSSAYSPRLQFRALELCVSVSLDRLQSSKNKTPDDEPPVSNSLMAAIKRSQANQRRHPETFHLYQMHQQLQSSQTSLSCVKVELKHFILSILDDPIVSRVFGDAGFRSCDIKIAILRPPTLSGFHKSLRFPPLFLCNLPDSESNRTGFNFPFSVDDGEEDFKRIGQVLAKKTSRNPLLIGVSADNVLTGFTDALKIGKGGFLSAEIEGLNVMCIEKEICEFVMGNLSEDLMGLKLKEVRDKVESCKSGGVIVNFGELKLFVDGGSTGAVEYVVSQLSSLVQVCGEKLWLIGAVGSYESYMKILAKFPGLEKELDLNLLPITSSKLSPSGSQLKSSLMGSFVPFGGFFPVPTELKNPSTNTDQSVSRCDLCNEKYEHEVSIVLKGGRTISVADQMSSSLPSWLQTPESDVSKGVNMIEAKDDGGGVFNARVVGLQRKWNDICHRLHQNRASHQNTSQIRPRIPFHSQSIQLTAVCSEAGPHQPPINFFATSTSSSSATSITTDLGLGTQTRLHNLCGSGSGSGSAEVDKNGSNETAKSSERDFKKIYRGLSDKVPDLDDCIRAISQTISRSRTRGDVWLMFLGPDRIGKRKIATALAEVVFGSRENLISIDLDFENQISHSTSIFDHQSVDFCDLSFRGKTITNYIAEELSKKPRSVVLLEHLDKADFLTQESLSRAIQTGKLSDTRGREIGIKHAIFVATSSNGKESKDAGEEYSEERILKAKPLQMQISVENVVEPNSSSILLLPRKSTTGMPVLSNKRKLVKTSDFQITFPAIKKSKSCFDLNLPVDETEASDDENDSVSESRDTWFDEFLGQVDEKIVFKPFDFDIVAENLLKEIGLCFQRSLGPNVALEVENEVMVQILASFWSSDRNGAVENWIDTVLCRGFLEVKQKLSVEDSGSIVKLVAVEEHSASSGFLPGRIITK